MKYEDIVKESIEFIKEHINDDLTAEKIASKMGYSLFHFCRIFTLTTGMPLMQYVRRYRLALARNELDHSGNILDVALQYGFESASGFSKSFRKEFGYTPTSYLVRMRGLDSQFLLDISEIMVPPRFLYQEAFRVAGYGMTTNVAETFTKDTAAFWDTYQGEDLETKMYELLHPPRHGEVGICIPGENGNAVYLFGVIVEQACQIPPDMMSLSIPAGTYAVFTTPPVNNTDTASTYDKDPLSITVKETWRYLFTTWFRENSDLLDEKRYAFEFYDERCHGLSNAIAEIYIPIKES